MDAIAKLPNQHSKKRSSKCKSHYHVIIIIKIITTIMIIAITNSYRETLLIGEIFYLNQKDKLII